MRCILKFIVLLILIILITIVCCFNFIPDVPKFKELNEFKYIENNKDNIEEVFVRTVTLLGEHCYKIDINKGYDILKSISFKKKTNMTCTDSDMYLEFYFKNDKYQRIFFECGNLVYNDEKYELKEKIILYNKDEFIPKKITEGMIIVSNNDRVKCK